jgi:hypothetical protein
MFLGGISVAAIKQRPQKDKVQKRGLDIRQKETDARIGASARTAQRPALEAGVEMQSIY